MEQDAIGGTPVDRGAAESPGTDIPGPGGRPPDQDAVGEIAA